MDVVEGHSSRALDMSGSLNLPFGYLLKGEVLWLIN